MMKRLKTIGASKERTDRQKSDLDSLNDMLVKKNQKFLDKLKKTDRKLLL